MRFPLSKTAVLHRNVEHRGACLALYRRLLHHARNVILPPSEDVESGLARQACPQTEAIRYRLKFAIRKGFRAYSGRDFKVSDIRSAMSFGYKVEQSLARLSPPTPDPIELARVAMFLKLRSEPGPQPLLRLQEVKMQPPPIPKPKVKKSAPRLELPSKLRHRPTIISANGFPFIRYSGTKQSKALSGIINSKILQRIRREDKLEAVNRMVSHAEYEDCFEAELRQEAGPEWASTNPKDHVLWKTCLKESALDIELRLIEQEVKAWERTNELGRVVEAYNKELEKVRSEAKEARAQAKKRRDLTSQSPV